VTTSRQRLDEICRGFNLLAVYLFGSRADDGLAVLEGRTVDREGSDLDVGVVFRDRKVPVDRLGPLQGGGKSARTEPPRHLAQLS